MVDRDTRGTEEADRLILVEGHLLAQHDPPAAARAYLDLVRFELAANLDPTRGLGALARLLVRGPHVPDVGRELCALESDLARIGQAQFASGRVAPEKLSRHHVRKPGLANFVPRCVLEAHAASVLERLNERASRDLAEGRLEGWPTRDGWNPLVTRFAPDVVGAADAAWTLLAWARFARAAALLAERPQADWRRVELPEDPFAPGHPLALERAPSGRWRLSTTRPRPPSPPGRPAFVTFAW